MESRDKHICAMYKHLVLAYTSAEARDILLQKYPDAEGDLDDLIAAVDAEEEQEANLLADVQRKQKPEKEKAITKMSIAHDLYAAAADKSRKNMIAVFMAELGLSKVAASTYYYSVKE